MEINAIDAIKILNYNFKFEIVETSLGTAIKMDWYNAFLYSNVTGSGYLDNYVMPFSPKGLLKIFYNAFNYNFVTGIFDNGSLKYSPYILSLTRPYLFTNDKYIIFQEFDNENELRIKLKKMIETCNLLNMDSTDYIIHRIEKSKKGNGMESFMEYLACEYFKNEGYIVENQIPLAATVGSPDFAGYSLYELNKIDNLEKISKNGFHLIELCMLRLLNKEIEKDININKKSNIVCEAKTSTTKMETQLQKYLDTGLFETGFELHPSKSEPSNSTFGIINIKDYIIDVKYPKGVTVYEEKYSVEAYENWLIDYIKFYLIANLSNDELNNFYNKYNNNKMNKENLVSFIHKIKIENILMEIKEVK